MVQERDRETTKHDTERARGDMFAALARLFDELTKLAKSVGVMLDAQTEREKTQR